MNGPDRKKRWEKPSVPLSSKTGWCLVDEQKEEEISMNYVFIFILPNIMMSKRAVGWGLSTNQKFVVLYCSFILLFVCLIYRCPHGALASYGQHKVEKLCLVKPKLQNIL